MLCDANGVPLRFLLSCGQASDIANDQPLLDRAYAPSLHGRPRKRCRWLLADKGNVEGEPPHRYTVRQAREKFCGDGLIGLCHAVFATLLFVQSLGTLTTAEHIPLTEIQTMMKTTPYPAIKNIIPPYDWNSFHNHKSYNWTTEPIYTWTLNATFTHH